MVHSAPEGRSIPTEREVRAIIKRLGPTELSVLSVLGPDGGAYDWKAWCFKGIMNQTGLDRRPVRLACRRLKRMGLAAFEKGLWTADGDLAGSGYRATVAGKHVFYNGKPEAKPPV